MRLIQSRYYVPNNMALVVTGDVNPDSIFTLADSSSAIGRRRRIRSNSSRSSSIRRFQRARASVETQPVNMTVAEIGWQGPSIGKDNRGDVRRGRFLVHYLAAEFAFSASACRFGARAGRVVRLLHTAERRADQAIISTTPDKAKAALKAFYGEVAQFDKPGYYTDQELDNAKTLLEAEDLYSREKLTDYTHTLAFWWSTTGIDYFRGYYKNLRATTREDINRYLHTYVQGKPHVAVAILSDEQQKAANLTPADLTGGQQQ